MYTVARLWELHSGSRLAGILEVGDMGAFPDHTRLDRSTARFAARDSDELGYRDFVIGGPESERFLDHGNPPTTVWCRGNHEDFAYLDGFAEPSYVDPYDRLLYVPDDDYVDLEPRFETDDHAPTRVAAFGGIPPKTEERGEGKFDRELFRKAQRKAATDPRRFTIEAADRALNRVDAVDVLLTHAGPRCDELPFASPALARLNERLAPKVHLFGHHHIVLEPCEAPGGGLLVGLEHLEFHRKGHTLKYGSCGLLSFDDAGLPSFRFFSVERDPWFGELTREHYRELFEPWD